jgi:hypothetical protein
MSIVSDKDWCDLPYPAAAARLIEIRDELRQENLHDTEEPLLEHRDRPANAAAHASRTNDGTCNDLRCPRTGSAGVRFGRNVPLEETTAPEPAHGQPRADDAHHVPANRDRQRARRRADPVPICTGGFQTASVIASGCCDESRFPSREAMVAQIMSVFEPLPFVEQYEVV